MNIYKEEIKLEDGRVITIETGKLAKQADGSVVVRMGDTMILATVVSSQDAKEDMDFLPLTVDYREKFSAAGKIPGGYLKREARPTDKEILTMRLVDRVLRPLFPSDYHAETQLMMQLMSYDEAAVPDALAGLAASAAIAVSDIPFDGPISEVRIARVDGEFVINPTKDQIESADIDMMIGATYDSVAMVEGEMSEISEEEMIEAIKKAHDAIKIQIEAQNRLAAKVGKIKREYSHEKSDLELYESIKEFSYDKLYKIASEKSSKEERSEKFATVFTEFKETLAEDFVSDNKFLLNMYFGKTKKSAIRNLVLNEKVRLDGRKTDEIRDIWCEVNYLPNAHGSAIFTRGETQSLSTVTLGTSMDCNRNDGVSYSEDEKFFLHYNFPPFSTGEARPIRGVSRREIGHGNLAQRALAGMIPSDCPYTIRLVSDILESNGSSSMATVCAGTMALLDAGIDMKKPVSGIAMGLITNAELDNYAVLSDILGDEDHIGDMDFKVTGTKDGITACQMDIKVKGLSYEIMSKALIQAKEGRLHILNKLTEAIPEARVESKPNAPKIEVVEIASEFIGAVIGPGGKMIKELQATTDTTIVLEEKDNKGIVEILGYDAENMAKAVEAIKAIAFTPEVGQVYTSKVKTIMPYGAFVEIKRGVEGLLHISEVEHRRLDSLDGILKEGDIIDVKLIGIDSRTRKMKLSRKVLLDKPE